MLDSVLYILKESLIGTLTLAPFIFLVFVIIELIETKVVEFAKRKRTKNTGPVTWASVGLFPHCGVGIIGAKLFSKKYITIGSLFAVIISITDEAIFILLDHPDGWFRGLQLILIIIGIKFLYAIIIGYTVDFVFKNKKEELFYVHINSTIGKEANCKVHKHGFDHSKDSKMQRFLLHPLRHAIPLIIFIFIVNITLDTIVYMIGEETFKEFFYDIRLLQPLLAVLVGIIPNCVGSIILIGLYTEGALIFPALIGGLINQAGLTKMVLLKENKNLKENLLIIGILTLAGLILGYGLMLFI